MSDINPFKIFMALFFVLDVFLFYIYSNPMSPVCLLILEMFCLWIIWTKEKDEDD